MLKGCICKPFVYGKLVFIGKNTFSGLGHHFVSGIRKQGLSPNGCTGELRVVSYGGSVTHIMVASLRSIVGTCERTVCTDPCTFESHGYTVGYSSFALESFLQ